MGFLLSLFGFNTVDSLLAKHSSAVSELDAAKALFVAKLSTLRGLVSAARENRQETIKTLSLEVQALNDL
jgi:hypothetical protein